MNLFELLKQLKAIQPDPTFSDNSKRVIFATMPAESRRSIWSAHRTLLRIIETGVAVALTGFFILLLTGALSGSRLAPVEYSAIDPQNLRAEAQAIDIQIQLTNLNYGASLAESTVQIAGVKPSGRSAAIAPPAPQGTGASAEATTTATSTTGTAATLDEALERLAR